MLPKNELGKLAEYSNDIICTIDEEGRFAWLRSKDGAGSTFTFTIAKRKE